MDTIFHHLLFAELKTDTNRMKPHILRDVWARRHLNAEKCVVSLLEFGVS